MVDRIVGRVDQATAQAPQQTKIFETDVVLNGAERSVTVSSMQSREGETTVVQGVDIFFHVRGGLGNLSILGAPGRAIIAAHQSFLGESGQVGE